MAGVIVVTACDANHYALAGELLASIADGGPRDFAVGFVNVGDTVPPPEITSAADTVVQFPDADAPPRGFRLGYIGLKAALPRLIPGYDVYVWLDGDTWVQNRAGLAAVIHCAALADLAIAPESDRDYYRLGTPSEHFLNVYRSLLGEGAMHAYARFPMINSGVFAARAASPLWDLWSQALAELRARHGPNPDVFFSDQVPLHQLVFSGRLSIHPMRAIDNWLVPLAPPRVDLPRRRLLTPSWPHQEINILHLVGREKDAVRTRSDGGEPLSFRYPAIQRLFADAPG